MKTSSRIKTNIEPLIINDFENNIYQYLDIKIEQNTLEEDPTISKIHEYYDDVNHCYSEAYFDENLGAYVNRIDGQVLKDIPIAHIKYKKEFIPILGNFQECCKNNNLKQIINKAFDDNLSFFRNVIISDTDFLYEYRNFNKLKNINFFRKKVRHRFDLYDPSIDDENYQIMFKENIYAYSFNVTNIEELLSAERFINKINVNKAKYRFYSTLIKKS